MAFTGKDPKDTYLALLNLGDANEVLHATIPAAILDAAGNSSILGLSQNAIEFVGVLMADVASGLVMDAGIAFEADAVSVDSVLNKSDNTVGVFFTSGDPEGSLTAGVGSLALRDDGVAGATLYVKESGTGDTGWIAYDFVSNFLDLGDTPGAFSASKWLQVDATGNFLEWVDAPLGAFTDLSDTPDPLVAGKWLKVNSGGTALEFIDDPTAAATTFINLPDTPSSYVSGKWLQATGSELTFVDAPSATFAGLTDTNITAPAQGELLYFDGSEWVNLGVGVDGYVLSTQGIAANPTWVSITSISTFLGLADTPSTFTADKWLKVDSTGNFLEWVDATLEGLDDTNIGSPAQGELLFYDGSEWLTLGVGTDGYTLTTHGPGVDPTWVIGTFAALDDTVMTTPAQGEVLYFDGTDWVNMAIGTDGHVLTTHGAAADPTWEDASAISTFAGLSDTVITTPAQGEVLFFDGSDWINLGVGTDGYVLTTHSTASDPTWAATGAVSTFSSLSDTVITTPAQGEVLFFDGSDWVNLAVGTEGYLLATHSTAANPTWVAPGTGGTFAALSDTNITTPAQGSILFFDGSDWIDMSVGVSGYVLSTQGVGADPIWKDATAGTTFAGLDDTVMTTPAQGEVLFFDGSDWVNLAVDTIGRVLTTQGTGADPIWTAASGVSDFSALDDTVITTPAQGEVLFFDGTDWVNLGVGTDGYALTTHSTASDPTWEAAGGASTFAALDDTIMTTPAQGEVLYFDGSDWVNLGVGTEGYVLTTHSTASNPTWTDASGGGDYLPLIGGTLTGDLTIDDDSLVFNNTGSAYDWKLGHSSNDFYIYNESLTSAKAFRIKADSPENGFAITGDGVYIPNAKGYLSLDNAGTGTIYIATVNASDDVWLGGSASKLVLRGTEARPEYYAGSFYDLALSDDIISAFVGLDDTPANYTSSANKMVKVNSTPDGLEYGPRFLTGTADPEGSIAADVGDFFIDTSSGTGAVLYVKATGTGNTGWDLVTSAAS